MDSRSDTAAQDLLRQIQQAIQLGGLTHVSQQPPVLMVPVVSVQQRPSSSGNVGLTPVTQAVVQINSGAETNTSTPVYSYKVKIINPNKKSDIIVRQLNRFSSNFESVTDIIMKFTMYKKHSKGGNISLWCDRRPSADAEGIWAQKRKQNSDLSSTGMSRQEKEEEVDSAYKELHDRYKNKYDTPRLRLWSRMITSILHDDYDNPPDIPAFTGGTPKRPCRGNLSDAISGAAIAFSDAISKKQEVPATVSSVSSGISPSKSVELCMKNYEQLRYLRSLYEYVILNKDSVMSKRKIFSFLSTNCKPTSKQTFIF